MEKWVENKKKIVIIPVKWQSDMPLRLYYCKEFVKSLFHGMNQIRQFSM